MDILKSSNNVWFLFFSSFFALKMEKKPQKLNPKINVHDYTVTWFNDFHQRLN